MFSSKFGISGGCSSFWSIAILCSTAVATITVNANQDVQEEASLEFCSPPKLILNGSQTEAGDKRVHSDYVQVKEVKFSGSIGPLGEQRLCKIKCIAGQWVGPLCVDQQADVIRNLEDQHYSEEGLIFIDYSVKNIHCRWKAELEYAL
ncbi:unnamed protein product [Acanthoscelides obtectus]|uniref:Uncharacterized protein n=1 Tax=Acanthoscelides obtectus TaxID=200917 RepID=A0A9P0Q7G0_ACAOB|nr:unnamed protein product [Acanthoscelides obtectus]CAK1659219.1 Locomotion-related protein Hikaru genki [Acanthoscelides obtectus]